MLRKSVLNGLHYSKLDDLLRPYTQGVGCVWMLHRVNNRIPQPFAPNSHLAVSPEFLDMAILQSKLLGYEFVSMDDLVAYLPSGEHQQNDRQLVSITLDDGYLDNLEEAVPVFRRHQVPYTIYIAPGLVDGNHPLWWEDLEWIVAENKKITYKAAGNTITLNTDSVRAKRYAFCKVLLTLTRETSEDEQREIMARMCRTYGRNSEEYARQEIMSWSQINELANDPLCTIGAHTVGHFAVARLDRDRAKTEMADSKRIIESKVGGNIHHFAYPYGSEIAAGPRDFEIAGEIGFKTAVTTRHGVLYPESADTIHGLPRISINGNFQSLQYLKPMLSGLTTRLANLGEYLKVS